MAIINENTQKLLEERYFLRDTVTGELLEDTAEQMFKRVAKFVAKAEKTPELQKKYEKEFFDLMNNQLSMPNTPTLINAGYKKCLSACSVIGRIPDNLEGIYEYMWKNAKLTKMGCGVGQDLSNIRPKGEIIKSSGGRSAGIVNWMHLINTVANTTIQGDKARRAANMVSLRFNHPDILDFIRSKQNDGSLSAMNISVTITDDEMNKIKNDENVNLTWNNKIYKTIKARDIFNEIIDGLYFNGEPGLIFLDSVNADNPFNLRDGSFDSNNAHYMDTTNPCVTGDTLILTKELGFQKIESLVGKDVHIWNGNKFSKVTPKITGENQEVVSINFSDGSDLTCTLNHNFYINTSKNRTKQVSTKVAVKNLEIGMKISKFDLPILEGEDDIDESIAYTMGIFSGDGSAETNRDRNSIWLYGEKKSLLRYLVYDYANECDNDRIFVKLPQEIRWDKCFVPNNQYTIATRINWLAGILDSDGGKSSEAVGITSINKKFLMDIKLMLITLGINSTLSLTKKEEIKLMPDSKGGYKNYKCQDCYRLLISGYNITQLKTMGLKTNRIDISNSPEKNKSRHVTITSISDKTIANYVYCFTEYENHKGLFNCVLTGQCGEQPLEPFELCNLMSTNLENMYDEKTNDVNWDLFKSTIETSIRFLDDVIDVNEYVLPEFQTKVLNNRKIGLGVAGYANLLIKMGIKYDSEEALNFIDKLFNFKKQVEENYNTKLAREKGNFPNWKDSIYGKMNIPARCSTISTQAPTGSVASILNTTAYGIEPLFSVVYLRRIVTGEIYESSDLFKNMLHNIVNNAKKEQKILKECYEKGTTQVKSVPKKLQDLFRCANDISPEWHIKIQAAMQKYYHNAISKTINAPEDATKEELFNLLINGWELGIKGVTYYRNNSRQNQTIQIGKLMTNKIKKLDSIEPIKRSSMGKTYGVTIDKKSACGKLYITINRDSDGNIVESFVNVGKSGICKSNIDGINRLISLCLRAGVKTDEIIDQLSGIVCPSCVRSKTKQERVDGTSCSDIISKVLKEEYMINQSEQQTENYNENRCPDCGIELHMTEGCMTCSCGYSKCS